ncbi:MAG: glycosyltransferase [Candidatus Eisenbacteria bacterium]|nr:glycosyltransferase [Candidatus Eisenbacteria bacterium]
MKGNKEKISVLHIIGALDVGGAEKNLVGLATSLSSLGFDVTIATVSRRGTLADELESHGIEVRNIGFRMRYFVPGLLRLISLLREKNIDVIHTHLYQAGILGRIAGTMAQVPVVVTTEHTLTPWKKRRHILLEKMLIPFTDRYHATCTAVVENRIRVEGLPEKKLLVIPNGVDTTIFQPKPMPTALKESLGVDTTKAFGTVARLVPAKGMEFFLRASQKVMKEYPGSRALIVGDGPLMEKLTNYAAELGISDKVRFFGERNEVPELVRMMDIFVLSSLREGLPLSLLEASACGKPIVATRVGGNEDIVIDGVTGFLVQKEDSDSLAEKILVLLRDDSLAREMGRQARKRIERGFSFEAVAGKTAQSYRELLAQKKQGS